MAGCLNLGSKIWFYMLNVALFGLATLPAFGAREYSFSVIPQSPKLTVHRDWSPLLKRLSEETNIKLRLVHYPSITEFGAGLKKGEPDFAYINPYQAILVHKAPGYIPLLRDSKRKLKGIVVVRKDSPYKKVEDLENLRLAFPSPNAFAASLYIRALMTKKGIRYSPGYVGTHANVYRSVLRRTAHAGGGVYRTLAKEPDSIKDQLRVIYEAPGVAPHPIVVHPRVPEEVRVKIVKAILGLKQNEEGKRFLVNIQMPDPVKANYKIDYMPLQRLGLERFSDN